MSNVVGLGNLLIEYQVAMISSFLHGMTNAVDARLVRLRSL